MKECQQWEAVVNMILINEIRPIALGKQLRVRENSVVLSCPWLIVWRLMSSKKAVGRYLLAPVDNSGTNMVLRIRSKWPLFELHFWGTVQHLATRRVFERSLNFFHQLLPRKPWEFCNLHQVEKWNFANWDQKWRMSSQPAATFGAVHRSTASARHSIFLCVFCEINFQFSDKP